MAALRLAIWKKAVTMASDDAKVQNDLAANLFNLYEQSEAYRN